MHTIWLERRAMEMGSVPLRIAKFLILPIHLSTWILSDAIFRPFCTSSTGSCCLPSKKGGMFNSTPSLLSRSLIVNPLSAMMEIPGLFSSFVRNPETRVSSTSEMEPTYSGDMYNTAPFGVQTTRNFAVYTGSR